MKIVDAIVLILLIIGGINMAIVGILHFDVIELIFGATWRLTVAYMLIALAQSILFFAIRTYSLAAMIPRRINSFN